MELLLETELLDIMVPELAQGPARRPTASRGRPAKRPTAARLWAYLAALDRSTTRPRRRRTRLILAALLLPPLRDVLDPDSTGIGDVGKTVSQPIAPLIERLRASRRDAELTRQILLAMRYVLPSKRPRRPRPRLAGRDFLDDALRLAELVSDAEALDATLAGQPIVAEGLGRGRGRGCRGRRRGRGRRCPARATRRPRRPSWIRWSCTTARTAGAARGGRDRREPRPARRPDEQRPREAPRLAPRGSGGGGALKPLLPPDLAG